MVLDGIINKNPEYNVIQIQASKLEGHELLFITCLHNYNPKMTESYYIYKNKLVTYFQTDENDRSYIIDHNFLYKYDGENLIIIVYILPKSLLNQNSRCMKLLGITN